MSLKKTTNLRTKLCYLDSDIYSMQVELETLQVIVGSYGQNAYLEETIKSSQHEFMQRHHFPLLFYAANIIFHVLR